MKRSLFAAIAAISVLLPSTHLFAQAGTNPNNLNSLDRRLIQYADVTVTNAQILAINVTPVTIVPSRGTGALIEPLGGFIAIKYTSTYSAGSNLKLWYTNRGVGPAASSSIAVSGLLTGISANAITFFSGVPDAETLTATNQAIVLQGTTNTAFTGGSASNVVRVHLAYRVHSMGF